MSACSNVAMVQSECCFEFQVCALQAMQGSAPPPEAPEVKFVPSVTIKKDPAQALAGSFWASAASNSPGAAAPEAPPSPAPQAAGLSGSGPVAVPSARPPSIAAAAVNFWQAAASGQTAPALSTADPAVHDRPRNAEIPPPSPQARSQDQPLTAAPLKGPTPSQKAAANNFWQRAAERTFSTGSEPAEARPAASAPPPAAPSASPRAAAGTEHVRPPRTPSRLRTGARATGVQARSLDGMHMKHDAASESN